MAQYGTLKNFQLENTAEDIRGSRVYGVNDEKLGKITDVVVSNGSDDILYVIVDTGGWLSSKEFIVPAGRIRASAKHENDYEVSLTKSQIENFPPYSETDLENDKRWKDYENRYRSEWVDGPVMHREATDRNITPTTQQMTHGSGATGLLRPGFDVSRDQAANEAAAAADTGRIVPAGTDSVVIENTAVGIGGRWDTFQSRLRERRKRSATGASTTAGRESAEDFKKAV